MEFYKNMSLTDINDEIWKDIEKFENRYQVSSYGRIKSLGRKIKIVGGNGGSYFIKERIRKQRLRNGYCIVGLNIESKKYMFSIHTLVAKSFIPNLENKKTVNHKGNKTDNRLNMLEWASQGENNLHAIVRFHQIKKE